MTQPSETATAHKVLGLRLDRDLHKRARVRAAEEERSLADLVREALEAYLSAPREGSGNGSRAR